MIEQPEDAINQFTEYGVMFHWIVDKEIATTFWKRVEMLNFLGETRIHFRNRKLWIREKVGQGTYFFGTQPHKTKIGEFKTGPQNQSGSDHGQVVELYIRKNWQ